MPTNISSETIIGAGAAYRIGVNGEKWGWQFSLCNTTGAEILFWTDGTGAGLGRMNHVTLSCDLSNTSKRHVFVNGVATTSTPTSYTNQNIDHTNSIWEIGRRPSLSSQYFKGNVGEIYYDNTYIDLATDNPFWDADTNLPKPVRQVISETGTTPLIALPMRGDDAGNNLGTGGDFTVNSGPYTGARGGSEFWARSAYTSSGNYLTRASSLTGAVDIKTMTAVFCFKSASIASRSLFGIGDGTGGGDALEFRTNGASRFEVQDNTDDSTVISANHGSTLANSTWYVALISVDMSNTAKRHMYINGVDNASWGTYVNNNLTLGSPELRIGKVPNGGSYIGDVASLYFNDTYIDFSQESNRNLFVDQLGYPKDLTPAIDAGDIPEPLIYMKFDDTSALGTNSGTGGDFTVNGTVTAGADVDPNA
jgi:hypothetical protein